MTQHIYLLRHGKVVGNAALYGTTDVAVLPEVNQIIAQRIKDKKLTFSKIYSSPLQRCKTLAQLILSLTFQSNTASEFEKISLVDDLQEMHFGVFDGVAFDEIYQNKPQWQVLEKFWQAPSQQPLPQAESLAYFYQRVEKAWSGICQLIQEQQVPHPTPESNTLIVCHGGVIRMILANILKDDINQAGWYQRYNIPYGSLTRLTFTQGQVSVASITKPYTKLSSQLFTKDLAP